MAIFTAAEGKPRQIWSGILETPAFASDWVVSDNLLLPFFPLSNNN